MWDAPIWEPNLGIGVEVLDGRGQPLPEAARLSPPYIDYLENFPSRLVPLEKGKIAPAELSLERLG